MKAILWLGGISILFVCASPLYLIISKQRKAAVRTSALSHVRCVGLSHFEFDAEFGRFPDSTTAPKVKAATGTPLTMGGATANQIFRQLIAYGLKSEKPFYAEIAGSRKPDDLYHDDVHALVPGEVGFAYIAGLDSSADPMTPIIVSPLIPGTTLFDPKPFGGKAVILRLDNSAAPMQIEPSGRVMWRGKDIFDPSQSFWKGKAPDIKWQE